MRKGFFLFCIVLLLLVLSPQVFPYQLGGPVSNQDTNILQIPVNTSVVKNNLYIDSLNTNYLFSFNARLDYAVLAGGWHSMQVKINGVALTINNLVNKPYIRNYDGQYKNQGLYNDGRSFYWFSNNGIGQDIETFYAPNMYANNLDRTSGYYIIGGEATSYEFDITPLLHLGNNSIEIRNNGNGANVNLVISGLQLWKEVASAPDKPTLANNEAYSIPFGINSISKKYIVRLFGKINYPSLAGGVGCLSVKLDDTYTFVKEDVVNKPQNAYDFPDTGFTIYNKYQETLYDGRSHDYVVNNFQLPYANDFYNANTDTTGGYCIVGGEAYQYDFLIPSNQTILGQHNVNIKNAHPLAQNNLYIKDLRIYEVTQKLFEMWTTSVLSGGNYHSYYLKNDGTVWAWGLNAYGQLGIGDTISKNYPVQINGLTNIISMASGANFGIALKSDGTVWAWGYNGGGQLGDNTTVNKTTPIQVLGAGGVGYLTNVIAIAGGAGHSLVLKSDGTVWAWGGGDGGALGNGSAASAYTPIQVKGPGGVGYLTDVVSLAAGYRSSVAEKSDGTIWGWGNIRYGGMSINYYYPTQITELNNIISISNSYQHFLAAKNDGTCWSWGGNTYGQLGNGTTTDNTVPSQIGGLTNIEAVTAGYFHSIFLKADGTLRSCGYNPYGQLGNGTNTDNWVPVTVSGLTGVISIGTGAYHSLALKSDGSIWAWGWNYYGQLGNGTKVDSNVPVRVNGF